MKEMSESNSLPSKLMLVLLTITAIINFNSCYNDYGLNIEEYNIVATFYDKNSDFSKMQTYVMPDSINHIVREGTEDTISREFDDLILAQIDLNMQTLGYQKIENFSRQNPPDLIMDVAITSMEQWQGYMNYYWCGYWGLYPGLAIWYPWYSGESVYTYSSGTVLINMLDSDRIDIEESKIASIWVGTINGLLRDTTGNMHERLSSSINQCFEQSPYLSSGK
jgi:hypothetical protein